MNVGQIGEIPLEDYIKIVGRKKHKPVKRLARVAGIAATCTLCMAAGDYLGPWSGKRAVDLGTNTSLGARVRRSPIGMR